MSYGNTWATTGILPYLGTGEEPLTCCTGIGSGFGAAGALKREKETNYMASKANLPPQSHRVNYNLASKITMQIKHFLKSH